MCRIFSTYRCEIALTVMREIAAITFCRMLSCEHFLHLLELKKGGKRGKIARGINIKTKGEMQ